MALTMTDAINACLRGIGEAPVASEDTNNLDAAVAIDTIKQVSLDIQSKGWWFNREGEWKLSPNVNEEISAPNDIIDIVAWSGSRNSDLTLRQGKVYDKVSHSFKLSHLLNSEGQIEFTFITDIPFEDLPPVAQFAVLYRARRLFAQDVEGDAQKWQFTKSDETTAQMALEAAELRNKKFNAFNNPNVAASVSRIGGPNARSIGYRAGAFPRNINGG